MYSDNTWITPLRIAEAHRQADLERSLRVIEMATPRASVRALFDTRAAGEPIAVVAAVVAADHGQCKTADQAA